MTVDHKQQADAMPKVHVHREDIKHRLMGWYPKGPILNGEPAYGWRKFAGQPVPPGYLPTGLHVEAAYSIDELTNALSDCVFNLDLSIAALNVAKSGHGIQGEQIVSIMEKVGEARSRAHALVDEYYRIITDPKETL